MRFVKFAAAVLAAGMTVGAAADALAWGRYRDHIYADSFGNLVIQSPSGYKRIVVGQGHLAKELSDYEGKTDEPSTVYLDDNGGYRDGSSYYRDDCYRPPHLWKGRSYMYGLPEGVVPQAPCADE